MGAEPSGGGTLMRPPMSLDEFAALVDTPAEEIRSWAETRLLDPTGSGRFDEFEHLAEGDSARYERRHGQPWWLRRPLRR